MKRALLILVLSFCGTLLVAGVRVQPVVTGSMAPRLPVGTLVATTPTHDVHVGEVVLFRPPAPWDGHQVLHRVVSVEGGVVRTRGDANADDDPWTMDASRSSFARLRGSSLLAGRLLVLLRATASRPAAVLWGGVGLLCVARRRRDYQPRHAVAV